MSTWANGSSSIAVGRRRPAAPARPVLALDCGRELLHVATEEVVELVVLLRARSARRPARTAARRAAARPPPTACVSDEDQDFDNRRCCSSDSSPSATRARKSGSRSQPSTRRRVERRPPLDDEVDERLVRQHLVVERLAAALTTALAAHLSPHQVEQRRRDARDLAVAATLAHQLPAQLTELRAVEQDHVVAPEDPVLPRRARGLLPRRTPHQLGHPGRTLHVGDRRLVVADRADPVDDLTQRPQGNRGLAERRQHPLDVAHEHAARADDEHAARLVPPPVGVEQVRRPVQRHDRLARPRPAGDRRSRRATALGSRGPARPGSSPRSSASSGRGRGRAAPSGRPRRRSAGRCSASASSSSSSTLTTVGPALRSTRRRTTFFGSAAVAW